MPFSGAKAVSHLNPYYKRDDIAKKHWQNVIYALTILKFATVSQIEEFINKKVKDEIEAKYNSPKLTEIKDKKRQELKNGQLVKRTVQNLLNRMMKKSIVYKVGKYVYSLTLEGQNEKIFGEYYGNLLSERLMELPFKGNDDDRLLEYVKRIGIFVTYVFMKNSNRAAIQPSYTEAREDYDEWINDSINTVLLLEWFNNVFYSKSKSNTYDKLIKVLKTRFPKDIQNLEDSEKEYYSQVFPVLYKHSDEGKQKRKRLLEYS